MLTRLTLALIWLIHFLPLAVQNVIGQALGMLLYALARERREVAQINLRLCFPAMSETERARLARAHFRAFGRSLVERGIIWWSRPERIRSLIRFEGEAHYDAVRGERVIWLAPHFVGLDMGGIRVGMEGKVVSMYSQQKNPVLSRVMQRGRERFNAPVLASRQDGVRPVIRALRQGMPFYYLPDMDFGARDSIFVPFFGVPAATITGLSRIAQLAGGVVVPCVTRQLPGGRGYAVRYYPAWRDFPSGDLAQDCLRMNRFIESLVLEMPEQYLWLHKRFKTRPPGEPSPYVPDAPDD